MKMQKKLAALAGVVLMGMTGSAMAGFTAGTGPDPFAYTGPGVAATPAVGGMVSVSNQPLATYNPDGAADPQITGADIGLYLFSLDVTVAATIGGAVITSGTYSLFYDLGADGTPDIRVSSGNASLFLNATIIPGEYNAAGTLTQVLGPANPAFADLAYGNNANIVLNGGLYIGAVNTGTLNLVLRQSAVVPEPVTLGSIAAAGLLLGRRRRA